MPSIQQAGAAMKRRVSRAPSFRMIRRSRRSSPALAASIQRSLPVASAEADLEGRGAEGVLFSIRSRGGGGPLVRHQRRLPAAAGGREGKLFLVGSAMANRRWLSRPAAEWIRRRSVPAPSRAPPPDSVSSAPSSTSPSLDVELPSEPATVWVLTGPWQVDWNHVDSASRTRRIPQHDRFRLPRRVADDLA
nr:uncharacterized protein LOC117840003 [Setaria viridis]